MAFPQLKCGQPFAKAVYDHWVRLEKADFLPQDLSLDAGWRRLNYREPSNPQGELIGANDGAVSCEEVWENGLQVLDALGEKAKWEEDPNTTRNKDQRKAIKRYQDFRKLIERQTRRPVSWVLEEPYVKNKTRKVKGRFKSAWEIRQKVHQAIDKINGLLDEKKLTGPLRQRCLIALLYWFVLVGEGVQLEPRNPDKTALLDSLLEAQGLDRQVFKEIKEGFRKYLQGNGGGLGLAYVGPDATFEATALETILKKRGWCTERSKIMYAVLRMAGVKAFFVEPQWSRSCRWSISWRKTDRPASRFKAIWPQASGLKSPTNRARKLYGLLMWP